MNILYPIHKFNRWFDNLQSTPRFIIFLLLIAPSGSLFQLAINLHSKTLFAVGGFWFALACLVACVRAAGHDKRVHTALAVILGVAGIATFYAVVRAFI